MTQRGRGASDAVERGAGRTGDVACALRGALRTPKASGTERIRKTPKGISVPQFRMAGKSSLKVVPCTAPVEAGVEVGFATTLREWTSAVAYPQRL